MEVSEQEKLITDYPFPVTIEGTKKILHQLTNCICKIENKKGSGTGFFCSISDKIKVLITNNHIIDETIISENNKIYVTLNDDKDSRIIHLKDKKYYTSEKYDITIIEINTKKENITDFLELDKETLDYNKDNPKSVYILQYPRIDCFKQIAAVSYGIIKSKTEENEFNIIHYCCTEYGSSGSPIVNVLNNKVIGIHKERNNKNYNKGTLLKYPIDEYMNKFFNKDNNELKNGNLLTEEGDIDNIKMNEINLTLKIEKKDVNKNIYFLNKDNDKFNKDEEYLDSIKYYNKLLKESKIEILINGIKYEENKKFFKPNESRLYEIKLIFSFKIDNMSYMFYGCSNITKIIFSSFNTKAVNKMNSMFYNCSNLIKIDLSSFETKNVNNMSSMFYGCSNLMEANLSSFNTKKVNNMSSMFFNCNNLTKIDFSSFDIENVTNMASMFCNCSSLINLNLSSFKAIRATNMGSMFYNCSSLINVDLSSFNTLNVKNIGSMFCNCSKLTFLNLSSFITKYVSNMNSLFSGCSNLTYIDLSSFDIGDSTDMSDIIFNCSNLKEVKINKKISNSRLAKEFVGNNINIVYK